MLYFLTPEVLFSDLFKRNSGNEPFAWNNELALFSLGRTALLNGLRLMAAEEKNRRELLVPSYICEGTLWPLRDAGFNIRYYSIDDNFGIRFSELDKKITKDTLALLIVHFFGIPQPVSEIKKFCVDKSIFLIEDCAHAFYGRDNNIPLGSTGDISFFSIRKFLPLADGAALIVNNKNLRKNKVFNKSIANRKKINYLKVFLQSVRNSIEARYRVQMHRKRHFCPNDSIEKLCPRTDIDKDRKDFFDCEAISHYSRRIFSGYDYALMSRRRRENYNILANTLSDIKGIHVPFKEAKEGWSPYALSLYVPEPSQLGIIRGLIGKGLFVTDWPTLPSDIEGNEKDSAYSKLKRIILFPVHQNISSELMRSMGKVSAQVIERSLR